MHHDNRPTNRFDPRAQCEWLIAQARHTLQQAEEAPLYAPDALIETFATSLDDGWAALATLSATQLFYQARATATYANERLAKQWTTDDLYDRWTQVLAQRQTLLPKG
jgi:hypothetical protein